MIFSSSWKPTNDNAFYNNMLLQCMHVSNKRYLSSIVEIVISYKKYFKKFTFATDLHKLFEVWTTQPVRSRVQLL